MMSVKSLDMSNGLEESKFNIIYSLIRHVLEQVKEEDDYYLQLMCYAKKIDKYIDELEDDEYNLLYSEFIKDLDDILSILDRSSDNFNKRMIF